MMRLTLLLLATFSLFGKVQLDGKKLYTIHCAGCHGPDGSGGTGVNLLGKLTNGTHAKMVVVVKRGIAGTAMPAAPLTDEEVNKVVAHVMTLRRAAKH